MNHHQDPWFTALPHDDEALLIFRVIRVGNHEGNVIVEHGFRLLECDAVFCGIARRLSRIPFE